MHLGTIADFYDLITVIGLTDTTASTKGIKMSLSPDSPYARSLSIPTGARKYDHVMPLLKDLHWLRVPECITYKLCVLVHNCLHGTAPRYLQDVVVAVTSRRRLRSTSSSALVVPVTRRTTTTTTTTVVRLVTGTTRADEYGTTIGDRVFAVAGPRAWNSLPQFVTDCPSPGTFRKYLKTYLFSLSF